jgi:cytochrome P450
MCFLLFLAGHETTVSTLSHMFRHFATAPADRAHLLSESTADVAVEECLRYMSVVCLGRVVTFDVEFHGISLKAGDRVLMPLAAADRDGSYFPRANAFELDRPAAAHMAFGTGPHRCLGRHLARRELRIALEEWHRVFPSYRLADDHQPIESGLNRRVETLVVVLDNDEPFAPRPSNPGQ